MTDSVSPSRSQLSTTYRFKCVDCGTRNTTTEPPQDHMLQCRCCGFPTVQVLEGVKHQARKS